MTTEKEEINPRDYETPGTRYLYILALGAIRSTPSQTLLRRIRPGVIDANMQTQMAIAGWIAVTDSLEEAKAEGLRRAREEWPEADGWREHSVATDRMDREYLAELLETMGEATAAQVGDLPRRAPLRLIGADAAEA